LQAAIPSEQFSLGSFLPSVRSKCPSCGFYERRGFALVSPQRKAALLKSYWTIPERQIETSVVLANPPDIG
jgi:hypothetical protein